jgi:hypothetical protein
MPLHEVPGRPGVYVNENGEFFGLAMDDGDVEIGSFGNDDGDFGDDFGEGAGDPGMRLIVAADNAFGDDDFGAAQMLEDEFGRAKGQKRQRVKRRLDNRIENIERKSGNRTERLQDKRNRLTGGGNGGGVKQQEATVISGEVAVTSGASSDITIRVQHDFTAKDIKADGPSGTKITKVMFGDDQVWSSSTGLNVKYAGATSTLNSVLEGKTIRAGLDVIVTVLGGGAGTADVLISGFKPARC